MPDGRFLSKTVANDWDLNNVSFWADYVFVRCIPHLDVEGRMPGHPSEVKGMAAPIRKELTVEMVDEALEELAKVDLVEWYVAEGRPCLQFPGFSRHQKGLRKEREAPSRIPSPKVQSAQRITTVLRTNSGLTPDLLRSGSGPAQVQVQVEVEVQEEVKGKAFKRPVVPSSPELPARNGAPPPEQPDGIKTEGRTAARIRAAEIIRASFHLGREAVTVGTYRETLDVAMAKWDRAVEAGADPEELNAELELVRTVESFPSDEPITAAVYFGRDRHETRALCQHERLKRYTPANGLPPVDVRMPAPPLPDDKQAIAKRLIAAALERERRAAAIAVAPPDDEDAA